jgi:hypothetical protein
VLQVGVAAQGPHVDAAVRVDPVVIQPGDGIDIDQQVRRGEPQLHHRDQALAARHHLGVVPAVAEQPHGLLDRAGRLVAEP